ncbi:MAG: breast carcinoma amplified sequence 2 [Monoraphidium minutum]|nr:MAG: breast carcinoma amplified sequence 2 [Monoraphidium minutum]
MAQKVLAIEATRRPGEDLVDALPYIDPLTPDIKKQVEALIEAEMRTSSKRPADYLKELPALPPAKFEGHPLLQAEYERVRARQPMPPLDITRFRLDPPPMAKRGDVGAWRSALDNAGAQLEHQLNRISNLELLLKFGPNAWRAQVQLSGAAAKQLEAQLTETRKQARAWGGGGAGRIDALNRERKVQQMAAGMELRRLEDEWANAVRKNLEICMACEKLEAEVAMLAAQLPPGAAGGGGGAEGQQQGGGGGGEQGQQQGGGGGGGELANGGQHEEAGGAEPMVE